MDSIPYAGYVWRSRGNFSLHLVSDHTAVIGTWWNGKYVLDVTVGCSEACTTEFPLAAFCRSLGQTSYSTLPLSTQQCWVPGGTKKRNMWQSSLAAYMSAAFSPRRWDHTWVSSNTRGIIVKSSEYIYRGLYIVSLPLVLTVIFQSLYCVE